ncbi:BRCA1-associated protein [Microdochium nivale]|nr:BRCA1-associated protein [Microdochium nivale]
MITHGSRMERHYNNEESATRILSRLAGGNKVVLNIQEETVTQQKAIDENTAGRHLKNKLEQESAQHQKKADRLERQLRTEQDPEMVEYLQKQQRQMVEQLTKIQKERDELRVDTERLLAQRMRKLELRIEEQQRVAQQAQDCARVLEQQTLESLQKERDAGKALADTIKAFQELQVKEKEKEDSSWSVLSLVVHIYSNWNRSQKAATAVTLRLSPCTFYFMTRNTQIFVFGFKGSTKLNITLSH